MGSAPHSRKRAGGGAVCVVRGDFGRVLVLASGRAMVGHAHEEWNVIVHRGGPAATFRIERSIHDLGAGEILLINPWQTHERLAAANVPTLMLSLLLEPGWLQARAAHLGIAASALTFERSHASLEAPVSAAVDAFFAALAQRRATVDDALHERVTAMIDAIVRNYAGRAAAAQLAQLPIERAQFAPLDARVRRVLAHLRSANVAEFGVDALARLAGVSRAQLYRLFMRSLGASPQHVIDALRIGIAIRLLSGGNQPIALIADRLGFSTQGHFTRFFVQHLAVSPSEYRRLAAQAVPDEGH